MATSRFFPSSHWSLIVRAQGEGQAARVALDQLLRRYDSTILALIRARRPPPHETPEAIKQQFLLGVWRRGDIKKLDEEKGRFRNWLRKAVKNHVFNTWEQYWVPRRGHAITDHPEGFDVAQSDSPEDLCIAQEALDTVRYALAHHREKTANKRDFDVLQPFLAGPDMDLSVRAAAQAALGVKANALTQRIWHLHQKQKQFLYWAVADILNLDPDDPAARSEIELELRCHYRALTEKNQDSVHISRNEPWTT
jgi:DNA-directed RNA polymerase specialized sigma24 family protein